MFNKRIVSAALVVTFLLIFIPATSRAASRDRAPLSGPAASLFAKLESWLGLFVNGPQRSTPPQIQQKNGCGMDVNGNPLCQPGTTQVTTGPSGS
jgi:hypothetical protein